MSETKFTPGPWAVGDWGEIVSESDYIVCDTMTVNDDREEQANAHLIAAAPKMYERLEVLAQLLDELDKHTHPNIELDATAHGIRALLAESRGEQTDA